MGRAAHPLLDRIRLVDRARADRRQDRAADRGRTGPGGGRRLDQRQPLQGRGRRRPDGRQGLYGDPRRRHDLPDRRLYRPVRGPDDRPRGASGRARADRRRGHRTDRAGAGQPRRLPHRAAQRPARHHPRAALRGRARRLGPVPQRRRAAGRPRRAPRRPRRRLYVQVPQRRPGFARLPLRPREPPGAVRIAAAGLELARRPVRHGPRLHPCRGHRARPGRHPRHPVAARAGGGAGGLGRGVHRGRTRQEPRPDRLLPGVRERLRTGGPGPLRHPARPSAARQPGVAGVLPQLSTRTSREVPPRPQR